jgi:copper transport protein
MRRRVLAGIAAVAALWGALGSPPSVAAHALRQSSDPGDGATLQQSPPVVSITFGEEPDAKLSTIEVLDTAGQQHQQGAAQALPNDPRTLRVAVNHLDKGVYTVAWRTVSAVDGHTAAGAFTFGVGVDAAAVAAAPPPSSAYTGSTRPSDLAVAGRWLLYIGLFALLGATFTRIVVADAARPAPPVALGGAWLVAIAGVLVVSGAQASDAGVTWSQLFSTSIGHSLTQRLVPLAITGLALSVSVAGPVRVRRAALAIAGAGAAASLLADVVNSHAAAGSYSVINDLLQWVHAVAGGIWLGGLAFLLLGVRGEPSQVKARSVRRFSAAALVAVLAVVATGIVRAVVEVGSWGSVLTTDYGRLIVIKSTLLTVLVVLGAINRLRSVPAASQSLRGLRRVSTGELAVAAGALLFAAALVNVAPPSSAQAAPPGPPAVVAQGNDFATTVRLSLQVSPGSAGFNQFSGTVTDYDTGQPVDASSVELRFSLPAQPSLGESTLTLTRTSAGSYTARGGNLSLDGTWTVTALVVRGASSVEVPLQVTPRVTPPKIDVSRIAGLPTLYTIHLTQQRTVQVYLDPDRPGNDIFHATFFDANGNELPVTSASIAFAPAGQSAAALQTRMLEPGHYVANVSVGAQKYGFDITGTTSTGETVSTHIDLTPGS